MGGPRCGRPLLLCSVEIRRGIIVEIRLLNPGDAEAFRTLRLAALKESPTAFTADYETNMRRPLSHFAARIQPDVDSFMLGALQNADLLAMAGFYRSKGPKLRHRGNIWNVCVAPDVRRRGVARTILRDLIALSRTLDGVMQIHLSVVTDNVAARMLYLNNGFEIVGRSPRAIQVDGRYFDEDLLVLALDRPKNSR